MAVSGRSHRKRSRGDVGDRVSDVREKLDRRIGRSDRRREVLEKGVKRGGGEVERPARGGHRADERDGGHTSRKAD